MLIELKIRSFGIIDELLWSPENGFNVITGETGAGKSLIIDAIGVLLEGRMDEENIRYGADSAKIEAVFSLTKNAIENRVMRFLEEKGITAEEGSLVISCEFRRQGRTVIRINGCAVARSLLRELSGTLVDIHGQSEHLSLFDSRRHLDYLDAYSRCLEMRLRFEQDATRLYALEAEHERTMQAGADRQHKQEILRYQNEEITRTRLKAGEEEDLEQRRRVIGSSEKLKALAFEAYQALNGDDGAGPVALTRLNEAIRAVHSLLPLDATLKSQAESLETALAGIEEAARDIRSYEENLEYDPRELEEIENRLENIRQIKNKYGGSVEQVLTRQREIESELALIENAADDAARMEEDITKLKDEIGRQAEKLSQKRLSGAVKFEKDVESELKELNMEQVRFEVSLKQAENENGIPFNGKKVAFGRGGADEVEFMVSTNPGEPMKPLTAIASTGEVSRFTLALKVALAEADSTPVLVFDEIDIGVGGRSGEVIGRKLWDLARHHQVISVTHLPQIAVFADSQYNVTKEESGGRKTSSISALDENGRIAELASMLGGAIKSEASTQNAVDMMNKALAWKKQRLSNRKIG